jgi:hypothetical protein
LPTSTHSSLDCSFGGTAWPDLPLLAELSDPLRAWDVLDPSPSLSAHSFPLILPPPEDPPPNPYAVGPSPPSSTAGSNIVPVVFLSPTLVSALLFDGAELLRRGLPVTVPPPTELSDTTVGGDFDENFRFADDCDVVL